nr:GDP-mannose 4,6-dehydratase [Flavobacteriales bacterium]
MKILVTGGLGFIGSNFITMLLTQNKNFEIVNVDAELAGSNHDNLSEISHLSNYEFI